MIANPKTFDLGRILATPAALEAIQSSGQSPADFLSRHAAQDWGNLDDEDRRLNDQAVQDGGRILSAYYTSDGTKLWIITEAENSNGQRTMTTILLPREY